MDRIDDLPDYFQDDVEEWVQRILMSAAEAMVAKQVALLEQAEKRYSGDLINSIGYATAAGSKYHGQTEWELEAPTHAMELVVGTAAPYAYYVKHGMAGYNDGASGRTGGIDRIKAWAMDKLGVDEKRATRIAMIIMEQGTKEDSRVDFTPTSEQVLREVVNARRREPMKVRKVKSKSFVVEVKI